MYFKVNKRNFVIIEHAVPDVKVIYILVRVVEKKQFMLIGTSTEYFH